MDEIIITSEQMEVIQEYLDGKIDMFNATDHQMEVMMGIIDKAEALCEKLDAYKEVEATPDCDLIRWYLTKAKK